SNGNAVIGFVQQIPFPPLPSCDPCDWGSRGHVPALNLGLIADDLPQRAVELRPDQLPPRMQETGNPPDSGRFSTVLLDLFGFSRNPQCLSSMKSYGTLPWWTSDKLKLSLCRPVAALTHWLDYRLYPDSPALMHAHNIVWFAAVVFL